MTTIKTTELTGLALDWAVAKCEDIKVMRCGAGPSQYFVYIPKRSAYKKWRPSTNWAQGGPIIERENLAVTCCPRLWSAYSPKGTREVVNFGPTFNWAGKATGPTPLIAVMRCYVASKLGDTVDVPEELL